jgi:hypothetical protein
MARSKHSKVPIDWSHRSWIVGLQLGINGVKFKLKKEKSVSRPPPRSGGRRAKEKKSQIS